MPGRADRAAQSIADLYNPFIGSLTQVANKQNALPARSNLVTVGLPALADGAIAPSGEAFFVPIPVVPGDTITNVGLWVGGTAASGPTHSGAGLYAGTGAEPLLLAKSADALTAAIAAKKLFQWALTAPYEVQSADCPGGFIYALATVTVSTTMPTAATLSTPVAIQPAAGGLTALSPLFVAGTGTDSGLNGVPPAKIAGAAAKAVAPIIILN